MGGKRLTRNTQCKTADVAMGKIKYGSGMERLYNHRNPPVSNPGTGIFDIALRRTKVPYPTKTCINGTALFHNLIPARLLII